jgi:hypothetical protein
MYSGKMGRMLQGVAADCNSAEVTHAWFDSMPAHHNSYRTLIWKMKRKKIIGTIWVED